MPVSFVHTVLPCEIVTIDSVRAVRYRLCLKCEFGGHRSINCKFTRALSLDPGPVQCAVLANSYHGKASARQLGFLPGPIFWS